MIGTRPILKDESQRASITNPEFADRVDFQIYAQNEQEKLAHAQAVKSGRINEQKVRGVSDYETDLMRRIAAATEQPSNNTAFRTQQRIEDHQKWIQKNLKEDLAKEKAYAKELQGYLNLN